MELRKVCDVRVICDVPTSHESPTSQSLRCSISNELSLKKRNFAKYPAPLGVAISERGSFAPARGRKPLPLGEVSAQQTERASPAPGSRHAAISCLFVRAILSLCQSCLSAALPSQSGLRPPAPPEGEPLAGRATFRWTPEARQGAKGRALLQRAAASGQRSLSSCRWPRQRSTTVPETSCFARPA